MGPLLVALLFASTPCAPERCEADCLSGAWPACVAAASALRPTQPARAIALLEQACNARHGPACAELASAYWDGDGSPRTLELARLNDSKACTFGFGPSCVALAAEEERAVVSGGAFDGMARAGEWLTRGCDAKAASACTGAARLLLVGSGLPADPARAVEFARRGCGMGDGAACRLTALLLSQGIGRAEDPREVERLRQRPAATRELTLPPLRPDASGRLSVTTARPGADVWLMGLLVGRTPLALRLPPGEFIVEADRDGPQALTKLVRVDAATPAVAAFAGTGRVALDSSPRGATVRLEGVVRGVTPLELAVEEGPHTFDFELEGFEPTRRDVRVGAGEKKSASAALTPKQPGITLACPVGATLNLDGTAVGECPWSGTLAPGLHRVSVRSPGFLPLDQRFEVRAGGGQRVALEPRPDPASPGELQLQTSPAGARVFIDGKPAGTAPLRVALKPGRHQLRCALDGFMALTEDVSIERGAALDRTLTLTPVSVVVRFESVPPGALVSVDGVARGQTPLGASVTAGTHELTFSTPGYLPSTRAWLVPPKGPVKLRETLEKAPPRVVLRVDVEPSGADVVLDGRSLGRAPVEVEVSAGDHVLTAQAELYETATVSVSLSAGERLEKKLFLRSIGAPLQVTSVPGGATVLLDGAPIGKTPLQRLVAGGAHELVVQLEGYRPQARSLSVEPTRRESHEFTLETALSAPPLAAAPPPTPPAGLDRRMLVALLLDPATPLDEKRGGLQKLVESKENVAELLRTIQPAEHRATLCQDFKDRAGTARLEVRTFDAMKVSTSATLRLDGQPTVQAPAVLDVPACIQRVEIESESGLKQERTVALSPTTPTVVEFDLGGRPRLASLGLIGELAWTTRLTAQGSSPRDVQPAGGLRFDSWGRAFHFTVAAKASSIWTSLLNLPVAPSFDLFFGLGSGTSGETVAFHFAIDVGLWSVAVPTARLNLALCLGRRFFIILSGDLHLHPLVFLGAFLGAGSPIDQLLFPGLQAALSVAW